MAETLGTLVARILFESNREGEVFEQGAKNAIVSAIIYMESKFPWLFYKKGIVTIPAGQEAIDLPDDLARLIDAKYNIGTVLYGARQGFIGIPYIDLNSYYNNTQSSGYPSVYSVFGNQLYVYPITNTDLDITLSYNYKDSFYPTAEDDSSIWFADETIDCVRYKALEIFYRDTLQATLETIATYASASDDFQRNLIARNNQKQVLNKLSI